MKNNLKILQVGDAALREKSSRVEKIDSEIRAELDAMVQAMFAAEGAGLAAPQVGILKRMLVMRLGGSGEIVKIINPEIIEFSENTVSREEGCLSVLGLDGPVYANVVRPEKIRLKWMDENGAPHEDSFDGIVARIIQHEVDHMEGILFIDRVSALRRGLIMSKVKKAQQ